MKIVLLLGPIADNATAIRAHLTEAVSPVIVLVNDPAAKGALESAGLTARTLIEQIPTDSPEDFLAYELAHAAVSGLEREMDQVRHGQVPLIGSLEASLVTDLIFFRRAMAAVDRAGAEGAGTVAFALTYYNASYVALIDLFSRLGHTVEGPVTVGDTGIRPLERPLVDDGLAQRSLALDSVDVERRPSSRPGWLPSGTVRCVLYLLTNDADLYLKPVYPLIEQFRTQRTPFLALTEDPRVVTNLARRQIRVTDLRSIGAEVERSGDRPDGRLAAAGTLFRALEQVTVSDPALAVLLRHQAHDGTVAKIGDWLRRAEALDDALAWCSPASVFLMPDAMESSVLVTSVARAHGIPTVTTVAASVAGTARALGTYRSDLVASYGHECTEAFRAIGWAPSRIVLTGAPALDGARHRSREADRASIARAADLDAVRPLIGVLTSRTSAREDEWLIELANAAARADWQILVKAHPQHGLRAYASVLGHTEGLPLTVVEDVEVAALVNAADVVVTDYSHAGREALGADRPLVAVNVSGTPYPNNRYDEEGVAIPARTAAGVPDAVARVLRDPAARDELAAARARIVDRFNWKNDGQASRRLYELLVDPPAVRSDEGMKLP